MRTFLLVFLMFAMFTPSLACAQFMMCSKMVVVDDAKTPDMPPCHGAKSDKQEMPDSLMFFKDCTGADLAQNDHNTSLQKHDPQIDKVFFAWADIVVDYSLILMDAHQIRGPPIEASPPHLNNHDLYLTTQRLRI